MDIIVCWWTLFLTTTVLSSKVVSEDPGETNYLPVPDFESKWMPLISQHGKESILELPHDLNEVPLLVDVRVLAIDGPNKGFMFQATGGIPRDDDSPIQFGGVVYVYNQETIMVSAPVDLNSITHAGSAIYTATRPYYTGPNNQTSHAVTVKVRAWRKKTLRSDWTFFEKHVDVKAGNSSLASEVYIEEDHGLSGYPSFVVVRLNFPCNRGPMVGQCMSDSVGSNFVTYEPNIPYTSNSYIVYGYDQVKIRAWIDSSYRAKLFSGADGYQLPMFAYGGTLEMYAWTSKNVQPSITWTSRLGPGVLNEEFETSMQTTSIDPLTRAWVRTNEGPNAGLMFPGSGALAAVQVQTDRVCSFGGLVYAYHNNFIRFWRPTGVNNSGLICVSEIFGNGTNSQLAVDADVIVSSFPVVSKEKQNSAIVYNTENVNECRKMP